MKRKGISPVIATILLIAIAVAAVAIVYIWYLSFQSRIQEETERAAAEHEARQKGSIKIEKVELTSNRVRIWVRNTGSINVVVDYIFVTHPTGSVYSASTTRTISPGAMFGPFSVSIGTISPGQAVTIKVTTRQGASAEASATLPP